MRTVAKTVVGVAWLAASLGCGSTVVVEDDRREREPVPPMGDVPANPGGLGGAPNPPTEPGSAVDCSDTTAVMPDFTVHAFEATYYWEDDGEDPGEGTDGTDPGITANLVGSETVSHVTINYPWDEFLGIESYGFYGTWDGAIEVHAPSAVVDAAFDMSWSNASFVVDGQLVDMWANDSTTFALELTQGMHPLHVEYHNHWHTTGFNASFTDYLEVALDVSPAVAGAYIDEDTKIVFVGGYESDAVYGEVAVRLEPSASPVLLVLHSFHAINWQIEATSCITAVVLHSTWPGSTVTGAGNRTILHVKAPLVWEEGTDAVFDLTGRRADWAFYEYALPSITIPSLD